MALLHWRDEFNLGIPAVDYEHQELFALINQIHDRIEASPSRDAIIDGLDEIYARIASHFALEEREMRDRGYDGYESHKTEHERLLDGIREIMDNFEHGLYADYEDALAKHLGEWFELHFSTQDARLHRMMG